MAVSPPLVVFEPRYLLPFFNTLLCLSTGVVAFIAWRSYLLSGSATVLWLGCGVLALGTGPLAAGWLQASFGVNVYVTIANVAGLLASICHVVAVLCSLKERPGEAASNRRQLNASLAYLTVLAVIALLVALTLTGVMPPFFSQEQGPSELRQDVVEWSLALLLFASVVLMQRFFRKRMPFLYWYSLALALVAIGLMGAYLQPAVGSPLGWAGRSARYLAAIYFLISVTAAWGEARARGISLNEALAQLFGPGFYWQEILATVSDAVVAYNDKGKILLWNKAAEKILGYRVPDVIGKGLDIILPDKKRMLMPGLAGGSEEIELQRKDGTKFCAEISVSSRESSSGIITTLIIRDVTRRKQAEEALKESQEDLNRAQAIAQTGSWRMNVQHNELSWSDETYRIFGIPPGTTLTYESFLSAVYPEDQEYVNQNWTAALEGKPYDIEHRILVGGEVRWVREKAGLEFDQQGHLLGGFGTVQDITERKRAESIMQARLRLLKFAESHSLDEFTQAALDESEALTGSTIGFYHLVESDQLTLSLQSWSTNTLRNMCAAEGQVRHYNIAEAGVWVDCVYQRRPVIHNNYEALNHRKGMPPGHAPVVRELVVPIFRGRKIRAIIGVGNKFSDYNEQDVEAVSLLGDLTWDITERKRAEKALRQSEATLAEAQRIAHLGNWEWDIPRNELTLTDEIYRILGLALQEFTLTREDFFSFVHPDDLQSVKHRLEEGVRSGKYGPYYYRIVRRDGSVRYIYAQGITYSDQEGRPLRMVGTAQDVTELKQAEKALRESEERFRQAFENANIGMALVGTDGRYIRVNKSLSEMFGYSQEELEKMGVRDLTYPDDLQLSKDFRLQCLRGEVSSARFEKRKVHRNGSVVWVNVTSSLLRDAQGNPLYFVSQLQDITARKQAEAELRRAHDELERRVEDRTAELARSNAALKNSEEKLRFLTSQVLSAQEKERSRIAMELHEGLGQSMTALKLHLRQIQGHLPAVAGPIQQNFDGARNLLNEMIDEVRHISRGLRPSVLENLGLTVALKSLLEEFSKYQEVTVNVDMNDIQNLFTPQTEIHVFRIFQESLNNIAKHAQATQVSITIAKQNGRVNFCIKDNGIGFNFQQIPLKNLIDKGMGLAAMEERLRMINAQFEIVSQPGEGTEITFSVPADAR